MTLKRGRPAAGPIREISRSRESMGSAPRSWQKAPVSGFAATDLIENAAFHQVDAQRGHWQRNAGRKRQQRIRDTHRKLETFRGQRLALLAVLPTFAERIVDLLPVLVDVAFSGGAKRFICIAPFPLVLVIARKRRKHPTEALELGGLDQPGGSERRRIPKASYLVELFAGEVAHAG